MIRDAVNVQLDYYNASVSEDAKVGTSVLTVSASDLDLDRSGNVTYFMEMTSANEGHFVIDKVSGVVSVARYVRCCDEKRNVVIKTSENVLRSVIQTFL